jgi:anti-sigma factor RsiW
LNCREVIHELSNYLDGDLDAATKEHFEVHLKDCQECAIVVSQTRLTVEIFCDSELIELPAEVRSRTHETLRRRIQQSRK